MRVVVVKGSHSGFQIRTRRPQYRGAPPHKIPAEILWQSHGAAQQQPRRAGHRHYQSDGAAPGVPHRPEKGPDHGHAESAGPPPRHRCLAMRPTRSLAGAKLPGADPETVCPVSEHRHGQGRGCGGPCAPRATVRPNCPCLRAHCPAGDPHERRAVCAASRPCGPGRGGC